MNLQSSVFPKQMPDGYRALNLFVEKLFCASWKFESVSFGEVMGSVQVYASAHLPQSFGSASHRWKISFRLASCVPDTTRPCSPPTVVCSLPWRSIAVRQARVKTSSVSFHWLIFFASTLVWGLYFLRRLFFVLF